MVILHQAPTPIKLVMKQLNKIVIQKETAQALMVQGLYTVFDGMATTWLRPNLGAIVTHVREGTLDFVLLKPIDSQFWLSLRTLSPAGLPEIGLGVALLIWGSLQAGVVLSLPVLLTVLVMSVSYTHLTLPTNRECRSRWSPYH